MTLTVTETGTDELRRRLTAAADALREPRRPLDEAADAVARLTRPPRRSGRLAASLRIADDGHRVRLAWGVGHAVPVNFGTRVMRARPFATDALAAADTEVAAAFERHLEQLLD